MHEVHKKFHWSAKLGNRHRYSACSLPNTQIATHLCKPALHSRIGCINVKFTIVNSTGYIVIDEKWVLTSMGSAFVVRSITKTSGWLKKVASSLPLRHTFDLLLQHWLAVTSPSFFACPTSLNLSRYSSLIKVNHSISQYSTRQYFVAVSQMCRDSSDRFRHNPKPMNQSVEIIVLNSFS